MLAVHDAQTMDLAVRTGRLPGEIDTMGYLDSMSLLEAQAKREHAEAHFEAALHGKKLK